MVYGRTDWIRPPGKEDFEREWPRHVPKLSTPLPILLECHVTTAGRLRRCRVLRDDPFGHGYGRAAIRMMAYTRVRPVTRNGKRVDIPVLVPVTFQPFSQPKTAAHTHGTAAASPTTPAP